MKLGNYYTLCKNQKNLNNNYIKVWLALFKDGHIFFMNTENSKTSESHRFILDSTDKCNLKDSKTNMALANLSIYYTLRNIESEYNNNKFKISAPTLNDTFDLSDGFYSIVGIQDYFEFIIKKHETLTENLPVQIYPNKLKNGIVFKIKTGYKLELLTPKTMRLLGSTKKSG